MSTGFVGLGAMGFPMAANLSAASEAAVALGARLQEAGLFDHVEGDRSFRDEFLFYRLQADATPARRLARHSAMCSGDSDGAPQTNSSTRWARVYHHAAATARSAQAPKRRAAVPMGAGGFVARMCPTSRR